MTKTHDPSGGLAGSVGAQIREARRRRVISLARLARESGVHRTYIAAIERGEANPTIGLLESIADALNCDMAVSIHDGGETA